MALKRLPNLQSYDSGKGWYMFKIVSEKHRPLVLSMAEPWQVFTEGLGDPSAHSRVLKNIAKYGVRAFFGVGVCRMKGTSSDFASRT